MSAYEDDEAMPPEPSANDALLSLAEVDAELPDGQGMPLISANVDIPANPAIAADVLAGDLEGLDASELPEDGRV